jgi:hypothetical protein
MAGQPRRAPCNDLLDALTAGGGTLRGRILEALRGNPVAGRLFAERDAMRYADALHTALLRAVRDGHTTADAGDDHELTRLGTDWARVGYPLADVLVAFQVPLRVIVDYLREAAGRTGSLAAATSAMADLVLGAYSGMSAAITAGYRAAGTDQSVDTLARHRTGLVRCLLWGALTRDDIQRYAPVLGVDTEREYLAIWARPQPGTTPEELARSCGFAFGRAADGGLAATVDGDLIGFRATPPAGPVAGVCGVGPPRRLDRLDQSFRLSVRALETADQACLTGVHEFDRLGWLPAVPADPAVGEALCRRYLDPLANTESGDEIVDTLRGLLANGMNFRRTAKWMFVHPNTVRYRIGRFEELTGVNLRGNLMVVFEVLWALEHHRRHGGGSGHQPAPP